MLHHQLLEKERLEDQLRTANLVQSRLLPAEPAELPGYDIVGTCIRPLRSRRLLRLSALPDGRRGIVIADVAGKGIPAALIMVAFRTLLRAYAWDEPMSAVDAAGQPAARRFHRLVPLRDRCVRRVASGKRPIRVRQLRS